MTCVDGHTKNNADIHFRASSNFVTCSKPYTKINFEGKGRTSLKWGMHTEGKNRKGVKVLHSVQFRVKMMVAKSTRS